MLDAALMALATTGGNALVTAMMTDGWESAKARMAKIFGRGKKTPQPAREQPTSERNAGPRHQVRRQGARFQVLGGAGRCSNRVVALMAQKWR